MKRILGYSALTVLILAGLYAMAVGAGSYPINDEVLQGRSWTLKSPFSLTASGAISNPTGTLTVATNAAAGGCTNAFTYKGYYAFCNESGCTGLSAASAGIVPSGAAKKIRFTRSEAAPSNALGVIYSFSTSFNAHAIKASCVGDTREAAAVSAGTTTYDCDCSGSVENLDNDTGVRPLMDFNSLGQGKIGVATLAGGLLNTIAPDAHQLDLSGATPFYDGSPLLSMQRTDTICASGCAHTSLDSSCADLTSTPSSPIVRWIGPGTFAGAGTCSGEDPFILVGAGMGGTILDGQGGNTVTLGTSKNVFISNLTIKGHRAVWWDPGGIALGKNLIVGVEMIQEGAVEDEDCFFLRTQSGVSGEVTLGLNRCQSFADGFTFGGSGGGTATLTVQGIGNRFYAPAAISQRLTAWQFGTIPCRTTITGEQIEFVGTKGAAGASGIQGYSFLGDGSPQCGTATYAAIQSPTIKVRNTATVSQNGAATGIYVAATQLATLDILSPSIDASTGDTNPAGGRAYGIEVQQNTTDVRVYDGKIRASGGPAAFTFDLMSGTTNGIDFQGTDWLTYDGGRAVPVPINQYIPVANLNVGGPCNIGQQSFDNGGATLELCYCRAANTWDCWKWAAAGGFTANGPAD